MAAIKLNMLKPSVNNLTVADLRAGRGARLRGARRLGHDDDARVPREGPGAPHADDRGGGPAAGRALGELRDHAVPLQQARSRRSSIRGSGAAGDGRQRDVLPDRHALSAGRPRHLSGARLPPVPGRGGHLRRRRRDEGEGPAGRRGGDRRAARRLPLVLPGRQAVHRRRHARRSPTSAWPRRSSSCRRSTTVPGLGHEYMAAMEASLGDAYSEPAADVRGYIAYVKSQA